MEVFLLGPSVGLGKQPRTFVEFDWAVPSDAQRASDAKLFGNRLPARSDGLGCRVALEEQAVAQA